jgi:lipopolysaccharide biosynthesis regulator YciM
VDRAGIKEAMSRAQGSKRSELALKEGLLLLVEDKNARRAAEVFKEVAEAEGAELGAHARLFLGHAYRAMGKRRTAVFTYQRLARREPADDATIARVASERLQSICAQSDRPAAADLVDSGKLVDSIQGIYAGE